ncbi:hypothetical protein PHYPSEUDO_002035 [Phytophthora pseudosyringae]|uniref:Uncharacterized protein n=1 Tax=Phytophthora pseudosyringae TaxID=221518 RepID=A0A8T1V4K9_9STRA|nr:hypothetical protein PHYPSEUDO_002035 [Phytophthora pseudosyringae]
MAANDVVRPASGLLFRWRAGWRQIGCRAATARFGASWTAGREELGRRESALEQSCRRSGARSPVRRADLSCSCGSFYADPAALEHVDCRHLSLDIVAVSSNETSVCRQSPLRSHRGRWARGLGKGNGRATASVPNTPPRAASFTRVFSAVCTNQGAIRPSAVTAQSSSRSSLAHVSGSCSLAMACSARRQLILRAEAVAFGGESVAQMTIWKSLERFAATVSPQSSSGTMQ